MKIAYCITPYSGENEEGVITLDSLTTETVKDIIDDIAPFYYADAEVKEITSDYGTRYIVATCGYSEMIFHESI